MSERKASSKSKGGKEPNMFKNLQQDQALVAYAINSNSPAEAGGSL